MMPIHPENRARYPKNWNDISARIRFIRAEGRCECEGECGKHVRGVRCEGRHGHRNPRTGRTICLTTAHLGFPAQIPFNYHVAGYTEANEIVEVVGFFMALDSEAPKWLSMMHDRTLAELSSILPASRARLFVSIPSCSPSFLPARPVVCDTTAASPILIEISSWRLIREPSQSTNISTKAPASFDVISTDRIMRSAALANGHAQTAFRSADRFVATGRRTSFSTIRGLLRCDWEHDVADDALRAYRGFSGSSHDGVLYHVDDYPENCDEANLRAFCNACHLAYDAELHAKNARVSREAKRRRVMDKAGQLKFEMECNR